MKEYLFFQDKKKHLPKDKALGKTGMSSTAKDQETDMKGQTGIDFKQLFAQQQVQEQKEKQQKKQLTVFSEQTMQGPYDAISSKYEDQYISAGFPPKICSDQITNLCTQNRMKCQVLEIGCGKGYVAGYLKAEGFHNVSGVDCSNNLLDIARAKNQYSNLERMVVGQKDYSVHENYKDQYDFVIAPSLINNNGYDKKVFLDMLYCCKIGGFIVFATKLNYFKQDIYDAEIKQLTEQGYWNFTAEHQFFRYDMLCEGMGKFSTKLVKVLAYQKRDYETMFAEQAEKDKEAKAKADAEAKKAAKGKKKAEEEAAK